MGVVHSDNHLWHANRSRRLPDIIRESTKVTQLGCSNCHISLSLFSATRNKAHRADGSRQRGREGGRRRDGCRDEQQEDINEFIPSLFY
jgi:hypothetical protein